VCQTLRLDYMLISHMASELQWPEDDLRNYYRRVYSGARSCVFISEHNRLLTEEQLEANLAGIHGQLAKFVEFGAAGGDAGARLVNNAESQGLGSVVSSWIGTGSNQPIAPDQVTGLLGQVQLQEIANRVGIPPAIASAALAHILPMIVDKVTPDGHLPQAA